MGNVQISREKKSFFLKHMIGNSKLGGNQFAVWLRSGLCGQVQGWGPELGGRIPVATGRPCVINGVHECPFADTATLLKAGSEGLHQPPNSALDTGWACSALLLSSSSLTFYFPSQVCNPRHHLKQQGPSSSIHSGLPLQAHH